MPQPLKLNLADAQRRELEDLRDHSGKPYLRERAAALLKIAAGQSGLATARRGLLKPRWQDTVYAWVKRYRASGVAGLTIKAGRGRKPAFSPSAPRRRQRG
jgi:transposase